MKMRLACILLFAATLIAPVPLTGTSIPQEDKKVEELIKKVGELERRLAAVEQELGRGSSDTNENHTIAALSLDAIASAEADFRSNDRDWNHVSDFWTGDVSGLYRYVIEGVQLKLIPQSLAGADAAPLRVLQLGALLVEKPKAKSGYFFKSMTRDETGVPYQQDTVGKPNIGKYHNTSKFGFCAYPAEHGKTGLRTFMMTEQHEIYWKDTGGKPADTFPANPAQEGWKKVEIRPEDRKKYEKLTKEDR